VSTEEKTNQIILSKTDEADSNKNFAYDCIFGLNAAQVSIYEQTAFNLVESVVEGYNGTIFAYGQTGCGKTFTMMGVPDNSELKGIIPRTFSHIMNIIESTKEKKFLVQCSFLEIYNEEIHDLLCN
jgi:Tfp pilus assembly pilus retraction ATPase PilT